MPEPHTETPETIKETLISIVIAFAMAFVFRGFVIEAFVIPTGSMAPTLMGAHMKFHGGESGVDWAVNPWDSVPRGSNIYTNPQTGATLGSTYTGITVHDPNNGTPIFKSSTPLFSGDRILVLKYLYLLNEPKRYDVVVFKNPTNPAENYIKRLIGLPGEELALVDGDVFSRKGGVPKGEEGKPLWAQAGWSVARKPLLQQQATWQTIFDSANAPVGAGPERTPWRFDGAGGSEGEGSKNPFTLEGREYTFAGGSGVLRFDQSRARINNPTAKPASRKMPWTIDDYYAYDEHPDADDATDMPRRRYMRYPVSDVRLRMAVAPEAGASTQTSVTAKLAARSHEFEMSVSAGTAQVRLRAPVAGSGLMGEWTTVASAACQELAAGVATNIEFWHSDQTLSIWIEGTQVVSYQYNWSPAERLLFTTGISIDELMNNPVTGGTHKLADPASYRRPELRLALAGGACKLYRLGLDRDLYYQPGQPGPAFGMLARGADPHAPFTLGPNDFFCCGDNSPASHDGRWWNNTAPWVDYEFRDHPTSPIQQGIVPRELMLGRAFFVYLPSIRYDAKPVPVPDFGKLRCIW